MSVIVKKSQTLFRQKEKDESYVESEYPMSPKKQSLQLKQIDSFASVDPNNPDHENFLFQIKQLCDQNQRLKEQNIYLSSELRAEKSLFTSWQDNLELIKYQSIMVDTLINDMMDLAKLQNKFLKFYPDYFDLNDLANKAL